MKCFFLEIYSFFKNPSYEKRIKIFMLLFYPFLFFLINFFLIIVIKKIKNILGISLTLRHNLLNDFFKDNIYLMVLIVGPIYEEFLFRAVLKPNKISVSLFVFAFSFFFLKIVHLEFYINIATSLIIGTLIYISNMKINTTFYNKNYRGLIYFSSILFGLGHLSNFNLTFSILLLSPILMLPRIFAGFSLAFIRVKFGLIYSILFHSFSNALLILLHKFYN